MTELLVVVLLLGLVLGAVLSLFDGTQRVASADQQRSNTMSEAQSGLTRMAFELRQACFLLTPGTGTTASTGTLCALPGVTLAADSNSCASTAATKCIGFVMRGRNRIDRTTTPPTVTRTLYRVRYNCALADPRDRRGTNTQCERFASPCTIAATVTCPAASAGSDTVLTGSVTNSGVTSATATPGPIFMYCARATALTGCSTTFTNQAAAMRIELAIARRGTSGTGLAGSVDLAEGVELKNNVQDSGP